MRHKLLSELENEIPREEPDPMLEVKNLYRDMDKRAEQFTALKRKGVIE